MHHLFSQYLRREDGEQFGALQSTIQAGGGHLPGLHRGLEPLRLRHRLPLQRPRQPYCGRGLPVGDNGRQLLLQPERQSINMLHAQPPVQCNSHNYRLWRYHAQHHAAAHTASTHASGHLPGTHTVDGLNRLHGSKGQVEPRLPGYPVDSGLHHRRRHGMAHQWSPVGRHVVHPHRPQSQQPLHRPPHSLLYRHLHQRRQTPLHQLHPHGTPLCRRA